MEYDHTNDVPPHQHGGTDAPECTTCKPTTLFDDFDVDFNKTTFIADPGPHPEVFYYGTRGHDLGGQLLRALRRDSRSEEHYMEWAPEEFIPVINESQWKKANMADGKTYERYPGSDTPQQWSRRGLSEHIRLELQALGIIPGADGNFRKPGEKTDDSWEWTVQAIRDLVDERLAELHPALKRFEKAVSEQGERGELSGRGGPVIYEAQFDLESGKREFHMDWDKIDHFQVKLVDGDEWVPFARDQVRIVLKEQGD